MGSFPVFDTALVTLSNDLVEGIPKAIDKNIFFQDSFPELRCFVKKNGGSKTYCLEGLWDAIVQAHNVLIGNIQGWNCLHSQTSPIEEDNNDEQILDLIENNSKQDLASETDPSNSDSSQVIVESSQYLDDNLLDHFLDLQDITVTEEEISSVGHAPQDDELIYYDPEEQGNDDTSVQLVTVELPNKLSKSDENQVNQELLHFSSRLPDEQEEQISTATTFLSSKIIKTGEDVDQMVNEVHVDIKQDHNYNYSKPIGPAKTPCENDPLVFENEIYMDIKVSKPTDSMFTDPNLPVTLVVAKDDEPGLELFNIEINDKNSVLSSQNQSLRAGASSDNQDVRKLKRKQYEELAPFKYFCNQCSFKSKRHSHMRNHSRLHDKVCTIYSCDQCDFSTIRASHLQRHLKSHTTELFACSECAYSTHTETLLVKHQRTKHIRKKDDAKTKDTYQCLNCNYMTSSEKFLQRHMRKHLKVKMNKSRVSQNRFKCNNCSYQTPSRSNYYRHKASTHGDERPYLCTTCGLRFKRNDTLVSHQITHSEPGSEGNDFQCSICRKVLRSAYYLKQHSMTHSEEKGYLCEICGAAFQTRISQRKHFRECHTLEKIHACQTCSKAFTSQYLLKRHSRVHADRRNRLIKPKASIETQKITLESEDRSSQWKNVIKPLASSSHCVNVLVHQESRKDDTTAQEESLLQDSAPLVPGRTLSITTLPVEYVVPTGNENCDAGVHVSGSQIASNEGEIIMLTFVGEDSAYIYQKPSSVQ